MKLKNKILKSPKIKEGNIIGAINIIEQKTTCIIFIIKIGLFFLQIW